MKPINQKIDQYLIDSIDEALSFLGEPVKNQIFVQLENCCSIDKETLPEHIEDFSRYLHTLLGFSAKLVEIKCMKAFYSKIQKDPYINKKILISKQHDFTFSSYLTEFRNNNS